MKWLWRFLSLITTHPVTLEAQKSVTRKIKLIRPLKKQGGGGDGGIVASYQGDWVRVATTDGWRVATSGLEYPGGEGQGDDLAGHTQTGAHKLTSTY